MSLEDRIVTWLAQQDLSIYLVGGCVRDRLLGRPLHDLDLAAAGDGLRLARSLANDFGGDYYPLDPQRGTGRAILRDSQGRRFVVDVARFRGGDPSDLEADLADRDFTINALAAPVDAPDDVVDLYGGRADLAAGLMRPVSERSIANDPLRALRALRQAAELGFDLAPETRRLLRRDGPGLASISGERIRDELARLLAMPHAAPWLLRLDELGLLTVLFPELEPLRGHQQSPPHHLDVLAHTLAAVGALEAILAVLQARASAGEPLPHATLDPLAPLAGQICAHLQQLLGFDRPRLVILKLAILFHDVAKPQARSVDGEGRIRFFGHPPRGAQIAAGALRRLRLDNQEIDLAATVVHHHMRPLLLADQKNVSARAIYRFFRDTGEAGVEVLLHALADQQATFAPGTGERRQQRLVEVVARMLASYWQRQARGGGPQPLLRGSDLLREFDLQPGPLIGDLLEAVREAQILGEISTRDQALALVRDRLEE